MWLYLLVSRALGKEKKHSRMENARKRKSNELSDHLLGKEAIQKHTKEDNSSRSTSILSYILLKYA